MSTTDAAKVHFLISFGIFFLPEPPPPMNHDERPVQKGPTVDPPPNPPKKRPAFWIAWGCCETLSLPPSQDNFSVWGRIMFRSTGRERPDKIGYTIHISQGPNSEIRLHL